MKEMTQDPAPANLVEQAKEWLRQNSHTPWALMDLELMEEYDPEKLDRLASEGYLMQYVQDKSQELTERHMELMRTGDYNHLSEIGDEMRAQLLEEYLNPQPKWSVMELVERGLSGEVLTAEQKAWLKDNLCPALAKEVDLLP